LSAFSFITISGEEELFRRYRGFNAFGSSFKKFIVPFMPYYMSGIVKDMGVSGHSVMGCRISIPPVSGDMIQSKVKKAVKRSINFGANVLVIDKELHYDDLNMNKGARISKGMLYPPLAFIDGIKTVSALMGIDFKRSSICIADASTEIGVIMTEVLLNEATYLTLCTPDKNKIVDKLDKYIIKSGLSPAVVSNYKKAMVSCDILIYTGGADIFNLTECICKKTLVVNLTDENIKLKRDILTIEEVILQGDKEPVLSSNEIDKNIFLTSRLWEGALLSLSDIDTNHPDIKKTMELGKLAKSMGIKIKGVVGNGRILDKESIYSYS